MKPHKNLTALLIVLGICALVLGIFIYRLVTHNVTTWSSNISYEITGQVGDFIGGVIGTILSAAGFYFLYITLLEQRQSFEKERLETRFFEMISLHRENVNDMNYTEKHRIKERPNSLETIQALKGEYNGRKVFKIIYEDFKMLYKEIDFFFKDENEIYQQTYRHLVSDNNVIKNRNINLVEYAKIDITFSILFFGLSSHDRLTLREIFSNRYEKDFIDKLISFVSLKPKQESNYWKKWIEFNKSEDIIKHQEFTRVYNQFKSDNLLINEHYKLAHKVLKIKIDLEDFTYHKYYGGHQFRLGHYFRHIYQSIKYINASSLKYNEKYENIKLLRAQISTFEQRLIFLNSVSTMGRPWELEEILNKNSPILDNQLITKYNFIKNIPSDILVEDIHISKYYPDVILETNYESFKLQRRKELEKNYK